MKIAIIHDDLTRRGGAEQVVLTFLDAFPNADLYTLCYDPENTYPEFKKYKIKTSIFQYLGSSESLMKSLFFPIGLISMNLLTVQGYDIVLLSTTYCAKYVSIDPRSIVFMYIHTPFRLVWDPNSYQEYRSSKGIKRFLLNRVIAILKKVDVNASKKANFFLGNTHETANRIKAAYGSRDVEVIAPPVKCANFYRSKEIEDYYLIVSRLEFYKKIDLAIEVFNKLGLKLIIVGKGSQLSTLKSIAKSNIEFRQGVSSDQLAALYSRCKALIFPQHEDYGITPLEANASGRPVIAYRKGGVLETMIPYSGDENFTAVLFDEQTPLSLTNAINMFEQLAVNPDFIQAHAKQFDESVFINKIRNFIDQRI